jgi:hypothetical protein
MISHLFQKGLGCVCVCVCVYVCVWLLRHPEVVIQPGH